MGQTNSNNPGSKPEVMKFVAISSIAAELHAVLRVAWEVSLAAKNARVMSAQAGELARGFQPITDFIDEIATQAINGVNEIDQEALELAHLTVNEFRALNARNRFSAVINEGSDAQYLHSLDACMSRVDDSLQQTSDEIRTRTNRLLLLLQEMEECMVSAKAIASVSRIVVASSGEYEEKLGTVSDSLRDAAGYINGKVTDSYKILDQIKA